MRLTELIDEAGGAAGYKFDLFDAETKAVVKAFATRDALIEAIAAAGPGRAFDSVLIEVANAKYERRALEDDGLILIEKGDVAG